MRVHIVDPPAYTPPYDRALAGALARAGAAVELVTTRFPHGPVPAEQGYTVNEFFYRGAAGAEGSRARRVRRLAAHVPDMVRYRSHARTADVVHFQWLPVPALDRRLLPAVHPLVFTMHWRFPDPASRIAATLRKLVSRMDAVVAHSRHGAARLGEEYDVEPGRIEVIPHGAFDYLTRMPEEKPLPEELRDVDGPVILAFGLIRPYKGADLLLDAFRRVKGAELWIVGRSMIPTGPLHELAERASGRVRFIERFVPDDEVAAFMRRADLVALPYRNIEQSGVLYTALAFGRPLVLSDVGAFPEIAEHGAATLVPQGDPEALAEAMRELLGDPTRRERMAAAALAAAEGEYSWDAIGRRTVALYERLLAR